MTDELKEIVVVTGHYGCGKTNFSLNLALDFAGKGERTVICDIDTVNPYFRTADHAGMLSEFGIRTIAPLSAGSNLDIPALTGAVDGAINTAGRVILDVGGDADGASALGRYRRQIKKRGYSMLYLINARRMFTASPEEAAELMHEIENISGIAATAIVNSTNLGEETTPEIIRASLDYARTTAEICGLPLLFTLARRDIAKMLPDERIYPVDIFVTPPW